MAKYGMDLIMKHELLVPVGNYPSLIAAINNGADAVYLGGKKFGARAFADNFTLDDISEATKLCHLYGVKIYITVNTLIYEHEIDEALDYVRELHKIGVDALIMQDVGFINLVHQTFPNLEIHASTQMHNHSKESLKFLEDLGVKRVVFGRELSLDYLNNIETSLEKEVFIHGSLCISYSGQCLFSSRILGRSGNRGECAGMCRLPYELYEDEKLVKTPGHYLLSPKDLSSLDDFKKLMDSNILCFKIEGRMKSPLYVAYTTKLYRMLMDKYENGEELKVSEDDLFTLKSIFNREYTKGFLHNADNIMNYLKPNHQGVKVGETLKVTPKKIKIKLTHELKQFEGIRFKNSDLGLTINFMYDEKDNLINHGSDDQVIYLDNLIGLKNNDDVMLTNPLIEEPSNIMKKIPITLEFIAYVNDYMLLKASDGENEIIVKSQEKVSEALNAPLSKERIKLALEKAGNTPFKIMKINIEMSENIFMPISSLNELRRNALTKLQNVRENKKGIFLEKKYERIIPKQKINSGISVLVKTKDQLKAAKDLHIPNIIVSKESLMTDDLIFRVPRDNIRHEYKYPHLLVTDYASLIKYPYQRGDYFLNITNHYTVDYLSKYQDVLTLSAENNLENIKDILENYQNNINLEVYVYGNVELMIMKYCPLKNLVNKDSLCHVCTNNKKYYLKDRNNEKYLLENNPLTHGTSILDCHKIDLIKDIKSLKSLGVNNFRIELLEENYEESKKIIERVMKEYE